MARPLAELAACVPDVPIRAFDRAEVRPDDRLRALEQINVSPLRELLVKRPANIAELRTLHDRVAAFLESRGLATLSSGEHHDAVETLVANVRRTLPALDIEIDETREDLVQDTLEELQRERIELHEAPLPVEVIPFKEAGTRAADLLRLHEQVGAHVLAVYVRADLLARQFARPNALENHVGHVLALQAAGADADGRAVVRLAVAGEITDLAMFATAMKEIDVIFLSTQASILDAPDDVRFSGERTIFVLIDQPILEQLNHTLAQGASIRWSRERVGGGLQFSLFVFAVDALPYVRYLHIAYDAAAQALTDWLRRQAELVVEDRDVYMSEAARIEAVVQHVVAAWWRFDQLGRGVANAPQLLATLESAPTEGALALSREELSQTLEWLFPEERELHAELEVVVLQQIAESQPLDAYALRIGPWRLDLPTRLAQAAVASAALGGAIEVAGKTSIPVVLLALVLRFLVDVERVEIRTRDRIIRAALKEPIDLDDVAATYAKLPEDIRVQLTLFEFADTLDRLRAAGMLHAGNGRPRAAQEEEAPIQPAGHEPSNPTVIEVPLDPPV